jgi:hypothetical protein
MNVLVIDIGGTHVKVLLWGTAVGKRGIQHEATRLE